MADSRMREKLEPSARNGTLIDASRVVSDYDEFERRPRNLGPNVDAVEKIVESHVPRLEAVETGSPGESGRPAPNGGVQVFRPDIAPWTADAPAVTPRNLPGVTPRPFSQVRTEEQKRLDEFSRQQSEKLKAVQRAEQRRSPAGLDPEALKRRHELEQRALEEHRERQKKILERRVTEGMVKPKEKAKTERETKSERKR